MGKKKNQNVETTQASNTATSTVPATAPETSTNGGVTVDRFIGGIEKGVSIPGPKAGAKPAVWKDTIGPMEIGDSRVVTGVKFKSLEQSIYKTAQKHFPQRKYKVWSIGDVQLSDGTITEGFRIGRMEDKPVANVANAPTAPVTEG